MGTLSKQIDPSELLWDWCRYGWNYRRFGSRQVAEQNWVIDRVKHEMGMILGKGLADFFLFTSDTIRWAKDNGVLIGPGRGSTAASLVAYTTRITEVYPYSYPNMIFERFLDVTRHDPPDIDVDCSDEDRWRVYAYLAEKYGADCVGHIGNFIKYRAKNALKDVGRVYGIPLWALEEIGGLAVERSGGDSRADDTLEDTIALFPRAQEIVQQFPDILKAIRLEGNYRGLSVHACGLMIANSPLTDICAVYEKKGERILSLDKIDAEYIDALKLDFLGLSTLGALARTMRMAGLTLEDLYAIPDTDESALQVFIKGDLVGVFQFSGRATRIVCRNVKPEHFGHLVDINALSRPGPLYSGQTELYVAVKNGQEQIESLHPLIDEITRDTYGQMIYQEHILRCLREIGMMQWTNVHHIRRIIAKKAGAAAFQQNFESFAEGAAREHGISYELSEKIWARLVTSGTYAFNIAHSVSYTKLAFWSAWLKAHYPLEFYCAHLAKADKEESFRLMRDALAHGIDVKPPDLAVSRATWRPHFVANERPELRRQELIAGWQQIPKIGAVLAKRIEDANGRGWDDWKELTEVQGISDGTVARMETFCDSKDPFDLYKTERKLRNVRRWIKAQKEVPFPRHDGAALAAIDVGQRNLVGKGFKLGPAVVYAGIVRRVEIKDIIEDEHSITGRDIEEIKADLKRPDLAKRATIHMYDEGDELIFARINRWVFPELLRTIESIRVNSDVVVIAGNRVSGFGTPVRVRKIWVIDPS
jgi:DNA polymerase III subunit alpha